LIILKAMLEHCFYSRLRLLRLRRALSSHHDEL
jgi:hypothetical protein